VLVGGSGGLVICAALAWLKQSSSHTIIGIIPDTGANYLEQIYSDEWLSKKGISLLTRAQLDERLNTKIILNASEICHEERCEPCLATGAAAGVEASSEELSCELESQSR
jgi:hypothetical protein